MERNWGILGIVFIVLSCAAMIGLREITVKPVVCPTCEKFEVSSTITVLFKDSKTTVSGDFGTSAGKVLILETPDIPKKYVVVVFVDLPENAPIDLRGTSVSQEIFTIKEEPR